MLDGATGVFEVLFSLEGSLLPLQEDIMATESNAMAMAPSNLVALLFVSKLC